MGCIEVTTGRNEKGYGVSFLYIGGRDVKVYAHRVAFEQAWGIRLQGGQVVRHSCDNPPCVNPLHLIMGTQGDNMRDMVTKGRHANTKKTHCIRGHELVDGRRANCPTCRAEHREEVRQAQRDYARSGA